MVSTHFGVGIQTTEAGAGPRSALSVGVFGLPGLNALSLAAAIVRHGSLGLRKFHVPVGPGCPRSTTGRGDPALLARQAPEGLAQRPVMSGAVTELARRVRRFGKV